MTESFKSSVSSCHMLAPSVVGWESLTPNSTQNVKLKVKRITGKRALFEHHVVWALVNRRVLFFNFAYKYQTEQHKT